VRHVRKLALSLGAVLMLGAVMTAAPALAKTETNEWEKFNECPIGYPSVGEGFPAVGVIGSACPYGVAGKESFFQAGKVTVHFVKPVILRGGFEENEATAQLAFIGALNGSTISREAEPAPSLTEGVDAELLPEAEKARYEAYLAAGKSTKVTATVELAASPLDIELNEAALLNENKETAFGFPVEIRLQNKFLGTNCYVGNYAEPIHVPFITGETSPPPPNTPIHGALGTIKVGGGGQILKIEGTKLVNNSYASPGVKGCGVEGGADAAINAALGLPSPAGSNTTELIGNLYQAGSEAVLEHLPWLGS
jgi:hypothetical protein